MLKRPGHPGALIGKAPEWIPDQRRLRGLSGMTRFLISRESSLF
jgi:hypothetical protein